MYVKHAAVPGVKAEVATVPHSLDKQLWTLTPGGCLPLSRNKINGVSATHHPTSSMLLTSLPHSGRPLSIYWSPICSSKPYSNTAATWNLCCSSQLQLNFNFFAIWEATGWLRWQPHLSPPHLLHFPQKVDRSPLLRAQVYESIVTNVNVCGEGFTFSHVAASSVSSQHGGIRALEGLLEAMYWPAPSTDNETEA